MGASRDPVQAASGNRPPESSPPLSPQLLGSLAREVGVELDPSQSTALIAYAMLLRKWNRVHNLTAADSDHDLLVRHLLDCLAALRPLARALAQHATGILPHRPVHFLDAGSGAGLPGIPFAIAMPAWQGTLVDAVQKKCAFLQQAQAELHIPNLTVRHARLETSGLAPHDLVVSRAFASLREFVAATASLLREGGIWAAMKGRDPADERAALPAGVEVVETITLRVPMLEEQRHLLILRRVPSPAARHP